MYLRGSELVEEKRVCFVGGRQLRSFRSSKGKPKSLKPFPEISVRGKAEEILVITPRVKQLEAQNYLKNVSRIRAFAPLITTATQSDSFTNTLREDFLKEPMNEGVEKLKNNNKGKVREKDLPLNTNSKFSVYFRGIQEEKLRKTNKELFPEELCEEIEYVPDYLESPLKEPLILEASTMTQRSRMVQYNTVRNVTRSSFFFPRAVDSLSIERSKFTTYGLDWRVNKIEVGSLPETTSTTSKGKKNFLPSFTERGSKSTDRQKKKININKGSTEKCFSL